MRRVLQLMHAANGWQRLWLVLTNLWLLGAVAIVSIDFPTHARLLEKSLARVDEVLSILSVEDPKRIRAQCDQKFPFAMRGTQAGIDYIDCLKEKNYDVAQQYYQEERSRFQKLMEKQIDETLYIEQLKAVGVALLFWLVPAFSLYGLGLAVAWVRRGFKHNV